MLLLGIPAGALVLMSGFGTQLPPMILFAALTIAATTTGMT